MTKFIDFIEFVGSILGIIFIFFIVLSTVNNSPTGFAALESDNYGSCEYSCGGPSLTPGGKCFCDEACYEKGDCCTDIRYYCK
ncbi:MAG: hypothetical protein Q8R04_06385 [Nanoarchaeota archaeon]|nr:hypothetical protein [Nanoarchaeota archaeon]